MFKNSGLSFFYNYNEKRKIILVCWWKVGVGKDGSGSWSSNHGASVEHQTLHYQNQAMKDCFSVHSYYRMRAARSINGTYRYSAYNKLNSNIRFKKLSAFENYIIYLFTFQNLIILKMANTDQTTFNFTSSSLLASTPTTSSQITSSRITSSQFVLVWF